MPRPSASPDEKRSPALSRAGVQMASTNTTANAFLGTKRPAWLTANARPQAAPAAGPSTTITAHAAQAVQATTPAAAAAPTAEPAPTAALTEAPVPPLPTLTTSDPKSGLTNLSQSDGSLLSPAPTDEASPAATNPEETIHVDDFASLRRALSEEQRLAASRASTAENEAPNGQGHSPMPASATTPGQPRSAVNSPQLAQNSIQPPTEATVRASPVPSHLQSVSMAPSVAPAVTPAVAPAAPIAEAISSLAISGQARFALIEPQNVAQRAPATIAESTTTSTLASAQDTTPASAQATSEAQPAEQNPYAPRVLVYTTRGDSQFKYSDYISHINGHINALAQNGPPFTHSEALRLSTLNNACRNEDGFFIAVNQILCLWLVDRTEAHHRLLSLPPLIVDQGLDIVRRMLESHGEIRPSLLGWLSQFPLPIVQMLSITTNDYSHVIVQVCAFLKRLVQHWSSLLKKVETRGYPLLMDELLSHLFCTSTTVQKFLSAASRASWKVTKLPSNTMLDKIFLIDQSQHMLAPGKFIALPEFRFADSLERINADTITSYLAALSRPPAKGTETPPALPTASPVTEAAQPSSPLAVQANQVRVEFEAEPAKQTQPAQHAQQAQQAPKAHALQTQHAQLPSQQPPRTGRVENQNGSQAAAVSPIITASYLPIGASHIAPVRRASSSASLNGIAAQPVRTAHTRTASFQYQQQQQMHQKQQQPQQFARPHPQQVPQQNSPMEVRRHSLSNGQTYAMQVPSETFMHYSPQLVQQGLPSPSILQMQSPQMAQAPQVLSMVQSPRMAQSAQGLSPAEWQARSLQQMKQMQQARQMQQVPQQQQEQQAQQAQALPLPVPSQQHMLQKGLSQQHVPVDPSYTADDRRLLLRMNQDMQKQQLEALHTQQMLLLERQERVEISQQEQQAERAQRTQRTQQAQQAQQVQQMEHAKQAHLARQQLMQNQSQQQLQLQRQQQQQQLQGHAQMQMQTQTPVGVQPQQMTPAQKAQYEQEWRQRYQIAHMQQRMSQAQPNLQMMQQPQQQQPQLQQQYLQQQDMQPMQQNHQRHPAPAMLQFQSRQQTGHGTMGPTGQTLGSFTPLQQFLPQNALRSPAPSPVQSPSIAQQQFRPPVAQPAAHAMSYAESAATMSSNSVARPNNVPVPPQLVAALPPVATQAQRAAPAAPVQVQSPQMEQIQQMHQMQQLQRLHQQRQQQQPAQKLQRPGTQRPQQQVQPQQRPRPSTGRSIFPPAGSTIARSEYPLDPNDHRAFQMSLTQLDRRSPIRAMIDRTTNEELPPNNSMAGGPMFYQYVQRLALGPCPTPMRKIMYTLDFTVTEEEYALRCFRTVREGGLLPYENHFDGSLGYRVRCCTAKRNIKAVTESEWVTNNTHWPVNIFIKVNGTPVFVRRQAHNGKDLPVGITELIQPGLNKVEVAIPEQSTRSGISPNYFFGVEIVETAHSSGVLNRIKENIEASSVTIGKINARLQSGPKEDDEFAILQDSISIDLADPFSARIFNIPVRGINCKHLECFDLLNWLNTRPLCVPYPKNVTCQHTYKCSCSTPHEPSAADKWRCPICSSDARPSNLRVDKYLVVVRSKLQEMGRLDKVKSILVSTNGKWKAIGGNDDDDDDNEDDDDDGGDANTNKPKNGTSNATVAKRNADAQLPATVQPPRKITRTGSSTNVAASSTRAGPAAQPVDVIEILDDD